MSDENNLNQPQYPVRSLFDNYISSQIFNPILPTGRPELVKDIPPLANLNFHQWGVNVAPYPYYSTSGEMRGKIFQRIRHVGEILEGLFTVEEDDFKKIFNVFINEFFFNEIGVGCAPELLKMELDSLELPSIKERYHKEDLVPNSRFRLYRRYKRIGVKEGEEIGEYSSALSSIEGYIINTEKIPLVRCSFNRGLNFLELFFIFQSFEATLQHFYPLLYSSGKKLICRVKDTASYQQELQQLNSPGNVMTLSNKAIGKSNHGDPFDGNTIEEAQMTYDLIMQKYNDDMARFGLVGDDDAKAERVTTGENYRALQPSASFQMGVISALKRCSLAFKDRLGETVTFALGIVPTPQGIPQQYEFRHVKEDRSQNDPNIST